jgi:hypothetical protein
VGIHYQFSLLLQPLLHHFEGVAQGILILLGTGIQTGLRSLRTIYVGFYAFKTSISKLSYVLYVVYIIYKYRNWIEPMIS